MLLYIFQSFPFSNLLFSSVLNLVFISIYYLSHAFLLNSITFVLFLVLIHNFMFVLKFTCAQHSCFYHRDCIQACFIFLIFILPGRNGRSLCKSYRFLEYSTSTSRMYLISYVITFYEFFIEF